jgi:ribosomal-protein-alanine N-acetyltransferase
MSAASPKQVRFVELPVTAMAALLDEDLAQASAAAGIPLSAYFMAARARWLWQIRLDQLAEDPGSARWIARAAVAEPAAAVVGHGGFHGPPDQAGMVEMGYSVAPEFRRQGYGRAIVTELLRWAAAEPGVRVVRATISPGNTASLATIAGFGFAEVGEQWDEQDGLELIFEIPAPRIGTPPRTAS